jgi:hypothetical protein
LNQTRRRLRPRWFRASVDPQRGGQTAAGLGLDRQEAEPPCSVAPGHESNPPRTEHADAVEQDHVGVLPGTGTSQDFSIQAYSGGSRIQPRLRGSTGWPGGCG